MRPRGSPNKLMCIWETGHEYCSLGDLLLFKLTGFHQLRQASDLFCVSYATASAKDSLEMGTCINMEYSLVGAEFLCSPYLLD